MKLFTNLFSRPSIEEVAAYQHKMPRTISVVVSYDMNTGYWTARVTKIDGKTADGLVITEAHTEEKLVKSVNDAVLTYLDFPEYMKSSMPDMLPEDVNFARKSAKNTKLVFAK